MNKKDKTEVAQIIEQALVKERNRLITLPEAKDIRYKIPPFNTTMDSGFDDNQFVINVKTNLKQIVSFISVGDKADWLSEYNQRVLESFVSSHQYNSFNDEKKVELINDHFCIMQVLKLVFSIVTADVLEYELEATDLIEQLCVVSK